MKLINDTAGLYPVVISFPYPKAGEMNSAARVGVISAAGGADGRFDVPGDARNNYLPRMEWANNSDEVIIQQLNRLQNADLFMIGDSHTGKVTPIMTEKDLRVGGYCLGRHRLGQDRPGTRRRRMG